jgi:thermitase
MNQSHFSQNSKRVLNAFAIITFVLSFTLQSINPLMFRGVFNQSNVSTNNKVEKLASKTENLRELAIRDPKTYKSPSNNTSTEVSTKSEELGFLPGKIILKIKPGTDLTPAKINEKTGLNQVSVKKLTSTSVIISSPDLVTTSKANEVINEVDQNTKDALQNLQKISGVITTGLDVVYKRLATTNDPLIDDLFHLNNTGQTGGVADIDVDAFEAWDIQTGSDQVIIAVIDDGMDVDHPDLAPNMLLDSNNKVVGYDFINDDDDTDSLLPSANWGHGTHVAGTIAARGNNAIGVSGVCQTCKIMPVKVLDDEGSGSAVSVAQGIIFAADNGAKIINLSLGGPDSSLMEDAINYAYSKGVLSIASAGNSSSSSPSYPAAYENSISVASITHNGTKSDFSNFGSTVDVSAHGSEIVSTFPIGASLDPDGCSDANFSLPDDGYGFCSGTSMAAPVAAGVAGLILSQNPGLSVDDLRLVLLANTDDVDTLNPTFKGQLGSGSVNAYKALNGLKNNLISMKTLPIIDQNLDGVAEVNESIEVPLKFLSASFSPDTLTNVKLNFSSDNPLVTLSPAQLDSLNDLAPGAEISANLNFSSDPSTIPGLVTFTINLESDQFNKNYSYSLDIIKKLDFSEANFTFDIDSEGWYADNSNWKLTENCVQMTTNPKYWHFGGDNCAGYSENQTGTLKSPAILLPSNDTTILNFDQYLENEFEGPFIYDTADVLIKMVGQDDSQAVTIATPCSYFSPGLCGQSLVENVSMLIPSGFEGQTVQFLFEFKSDNITNSAGWYIDNISLQNTPLVQEQLTNVVDENNNMIVEPNEIVNLEYTYTNYSTTTTANVEPSFDPIQNIAFSTPLPSFTLIAGETKVFTVQAQVENQVKTFAIWRANKTVNTIVIPNLNDDYLYVQQAINLPLDNDLSQSQIYDSGDVYGNNWRYTSTNCPNVAGNNGQIYFGTLECTELPINFDEGGSFYTPALIPSSNKDLELILDQYIDTQSDVDGLIDGSRIYFYSNKLNEYYPVIDNQNGCLIEDDTYGNYFSQCPKPEWHTSKFTIPQEVIDNGVFHVIFQFEQIQNPIRTADTFGWFIDSIKIQEVNLAPVIAVNPLILPTSIDQQVSFDLITQANITDPESDSLDIILGAPTEGGQIIFDTVTNKYIYTPALAFQGTETVKYEVSDSNGNTTEGILEFIVTSNSSSSSSSSISVSSSSSNSSSSISSSTSSSDSTSSSSNNSSSSDSTSSSISSSTSSSDSSSSSSNSSDSTSSSSNSSSSLESSSSSIITSSSSSDTSSINSSSSSSRVSSSSSIIFSSSSRISTPAQVVDNRNPVSNNNASSSSISSSSSLSSTSSSSTSSQIESTQSSNSNIPSVLGVSEVNQRCQNKNLPWIPTIPVVILVIALIIIIVAFLLFSSTSARMLVAALALIAVIASFILYNNRDACQNGWWVVAVLGVINLLSAVGLLVKKSK